MEKSGDVTDLDGQTNTQQGKVELVSFWSVRIWVSQYITWNGNSERPQFTSSLTMWPFYSIKRGVILCKRWIMYKHTFYCFSGHKRYPESVTKVWLTHLGKPFFKKPHSYERFSQTGGKGVSPFSNFYSEI